MLVYSPLQADETTEEQTRETHGYFSFGVGNQSEDSPWFGRYTGLTEAGTFLTGEVDVMSKASDGTHTQFVGRRLGLESQSLMLDHDSQGRFRLNLRHDEIPYYQYDYARTPYVELDDNILQLPNSLLDEQSYQTVDLKTDRRRDQAEIVIVPTENWLTSFSYRQDRRQGNLLSGGGLGYSTRNMALSALSETIDYTTDLIDAKLSYARDKGNLELAYHLSSFRNHNQSLSWQNPFPNTSGNSGMYGQLATEPDNDFQQLMLSGGYQLPGNTYFSGVLSSGLMTQDQDYLPYTTNAAIQTYALPRDSLDGEIMQNVAQLKLSSRPVRDWLLNASYRYYDHDNNTPQAAYTYAVADSLPPGKTGRSEEDLTAINSPLSYNRHTTRLDAKYRFNSATSLQLGYDLTNTDRENSEVDQTDEQGLWGKFKWKLRRNNLDGWIKFGRVSRDTSGYHPTVDRYDLYIDNPLLRKYNLADLEREEIRFRANYIPIPSLSFSANLAWFEDDYTDSLVGLTAASNQSATIEASYAPTQDLTTYAFYARDLIESDQSGRETPPASSGTFESAHQADWQARLNDTMDNFGIGAMWQDALPKIDLGADYVYAKTVGETELIHAAATPFSDITTDLYSFKVYARFRPTRQLSYRVSYWRDRYDSSDWALDGVTPISADYPTSLLMVSDSPNYDVNIVMLSMRYSF